MMLNILHNNFTTLPDSMHNFNRWLKNSDERMHCSCTCHPMAGEFCTHLLFFQQFVNKITDEIFSSNKHTRSQFLINTTHTVCTVTHSSTCNSPCGAHVTHLQHSVDCQLSQTLQSVSWCQDEACEVSCCRQERTLPR